MAEVGAGWSEASSWGEHAVVTCRTAAGLLVELIECTLPPGLRRQVEAHFGRCPACARFADGYRKTSALCRRAWVRQSPPGLEQRLMRYLRERTRGRPVARESD